MKELFKILKENIENYINLYYNSIKKNSDSFYNDMNNQNNSYNNGIFLNFLQEEKSFLEKLISDSSLQFNKNIDRFSFEFIYSLKNTYKYLIDNTFLPSNIFSYKFSFSESYFSSNFFSTLKLNENIKINSKISFFLYKKNMTFFVFNPLYLLSYNYSDKEITLNHSLRLLFRGFRLGSFINLYFLNSLKKEKDNIKYVSHSILTDRRRKQLEKFIKGFDETKTYNFNWYFNEFKNNLIIDIKKSFF